MKQFGNLYLYSTFGQLTNYVSSSNQPCRLKRTVKKLSTIYLQIGMLLRFAYSHRMQFLLSDYTFCIILVKVKALKKNRSFLSTESEWRMVLHSIFEKLGLQLEGINEKT